MHVYCILQPENLFLIFVDNFKVLFCNQIHLTTDRWNWIVNLWINEENLFGILVYDDSLSSCPSLSFAYFVALTLAMQ